MPENATPDELVSVVVAGKVVDSDDPLPVAVVGPAGGTPTGTMENGTETSADQTVGGKKVWSAPASAVKALLLQNTGATNNVRVGKSGVSATTGLQLRPGQVVVFSGPVPSNDLYAFAEAGSSTVLAQVLD